MILNVVFKGRIFGKDKSVKDVFKGTDLVLIYLQ